MPLEEGRGGIREKSFSKSVLIGTLLRDMHPATRAAFTVEPRHEMFFFFKVSLLYNFSVTEAASSISFHNLESSPEPTYRAVVEVPPISSRGVDDPRELFPSRSML